MLTLQSLQTFSMFTSNRKKTNLSTTRLRLVIEADSRRESSKCNVDFVVFDFVAVKVSNQNRVDISSSMMANLHFTTSWNCNKYSNFLHTPRVDCGSPSISKSVMRNDSSCVGLAKGKREIYPRLSIQHRVESTLQVNCTWLHYLRNYSQ